MDYSAVSRAVKRFEQKSKDNHEIEEIKKRMMAALREDLMLNVETIPQNILQKRFLKLKLVALTKQL